VRRWPVILTSIIDSVYSENHDLTDVNDKIDKLEEGKVLIATLSRLKYGMARDRVLEYVPVSDSSSILLPCDVVQERTLALICPR
jgi:damage-control phosphatase, subfamily III